MPLSEAQRKANDKYIKEHYRQVKLSMPNEEADELEAYCKENGHTRAGFIRQAVKEKMAKVGSTPDWSTSFPPKLQEAIKAVSALTGETPQQLIIRSVMQNLHGDIEALCYGLFEPTVQLSKKKRVALNELVKDATGLGVTDWTIEQKPMDSEGREYVKEHTPHDLITPDEVKRIMS